MGKDKVFLHISNETFIERLFLRGRRSFDRVLISTDTKEHAALIRAVLPPEEQETEIIIDRYPETGPLGALCSVFEETDLSDFALLPVDVPNADMEFLLKMYDRKNSATIIIAESENGQYEPLIGVYTKEAYPVLKEALKRHDHKVIRVIAGSFEAVKFDTEQQKAFRNVNTRTDYKELEA